MVRFPKISSYPVESLSFRALALFRVVHVIDCVIPFLCSTSPDVDLVTKPLSERPYPLASFTENSFSSPVTLDVPDSQIDFRCKNGGKLMRLYRCVSCTGYPIHRYIRPIRLQIYFCALKIRAMK